MSELNKQPKPKRQWLRFSLRTFLIVVILLSAWIGWFLYRVEQQREAVSWVLENGGTVYYDYQLDSKSHILNDNQPPVPKWLLNILDVNYFSSVTGVSISDRIQFTDLTTIADLPNLEVLLIYASQVSDLTPLAGLTNLQQLLLEEVQVTDLTPLADLTNLKKLWLINDCQVDHKEIKKLQQALPNCNIYQN